jgi:hypothetical protein
LRFNAQGTGWNVGKYQQTGEVQISLHESRSVLAGPTEDECYLIKSRTDEPYGSPDDLMTGDYEVNSANVTAPDTGVYIKQTAPLPLTVLGVFYDPIIGG